jgi:hypothetical protein
MRVNLTHDEIDLIIRLLSCCDDADDDIQTVARRTERYLRRLVAEERKKSGRAE